MKARLRHRVEYALLRLTIGLLGRLPVHTARAIGAWLGGLGYWPFGVRRRVVERQIAAAFPGVEAADVARIARASYRNLGRVAIELAILPTLGPRGVLSLFEGEDDRALLHRAYAEGRGVILATGHLGSWELAGAFLPALGLPIDVVVRGMVNPLFNDYVNRARARAGMRVIADRDAVRRIPRALGEGHGIGLVADQGVLGLASTYVPFFGRPAKTPRGPAVFALRFSTPMLFCAAILQPSGKYRFTVREIAVSRTDDLDHDVQSAVAAFTRELERLVRRYPEQYFWQHKRWKRQPPDTPPELRDPTL
jgi:KDO2-lipid IV(A) lauroyltransferase